MPVADHSITDEELVKKIEQNRAHRKRVLALENKVLEMRLERSKLLREHYKEHWLKVDLKNYQTKMESLVSKSRFMVYQTVRKRMDDLKGELAGKNSELDKQIVELEKKLDQYKRLDPSLLDEYQRLKEELDCQNLLIEMSGGNVDKLPKSSP